MNHETQSVESVFARFADDEDLDLLRFMGPASDIPPREDVIHNVITPLLDILKRRILATVGIAT